MKMSNMFVGYFPVVSLLTSCRRHVLFFSRIVKNCIYYIFTQEKLHKTVPYYINVQVAGIVRKCIKFINKKDWYPLSQCISLNNFKNDKRL